MDAHKEFYLEFRYISILSISKFIDTEQASPHTILVIWSARVDNNKYRDHNLLVHTTNQSLLCACNVECKVR